jgi:hypothetical protein
MKDEVKYFFQTDYVGDLSQIEATPEIRYLNKGDHVIVNNKIWTVSHKSFCTDSNSFNVFIGVELHNFEQ